MISPFRAPFAEADEAIAGVLLGNAALGNEAEARIDARARGLIDAIRANSGGLGGVEEVLREYRLTTKEGLALMILAEALLRVPDSVTADQLIEDKLGQGDFAHHEPQSDSFLVNASAWALGFSARIIQPGETPESIIGVLAKRIGLPALRAATRQAMRLMGNHFVLGETIGAALDRAASGSARLYRYSFDMLGEGARTAEDASRYFDSYAAAIEAIGQRAGSASLPARPGISVKLSALHPRYEAVSRERVMRELTPRLIDLARHARRFDLNFTIDAEEADRLELALDLFAAVAADAQLKKWTGLGLAVQAYQKRAAAVVEWLDALAKDSNRRFMVRLVKGAYWDTEVKRAQERGLADYPVFTRKAMTDLNYAAAARLLLEKRARLYPQFATHNALTVAWIVEAADGAGGYEFQRLHGMGEALYAKLMADLPEAACRAYAPVGGHRELLAYLVRRLLENGANSSFVNIAGDSSIPAEELLRRPSALIGSAARARHKHIPLPKNIYAPRRLNSAGFEFGHAESLAILMRDARIGAGKIEAASIIGGEPQDGVTRAVANPANGAPVGKSIDAAPALAQAAVAAAVRAFRRWENTGVAMRAAALNQAADLIEARRGRFVWLLQSEAGKTLDDALAEIREAVDFCRYYASEALAHFGDGLRMPGPTGEENRLRQRGRGVFVCISPWNFPLAIFLGQIAAALAAGNTVVAKPAEQTPLIAFEAVKLMHEAGIPADALNLLLGDGAVGAALTANTAIAGVAFTGSTEVARLINRALAAKDGPIVPLIAETGGINAMIVDATALPEQVTDDVVMSAFRSAGQRCSALRLLCLQEDIADKIITMIAGAARDLKVGDPADADTHIGPVIDVEAKASLEAHIARMKKSARVHLAIEAPQPGCFVAPHIFEITKASELTHEVFGPVLHILRWKAARGGRSGIHAVLDSIDALGFGLTGGLHTRIDTVMRQLEERSPAGNLYINRNMIGAVVGTQPFGGSGLSGTGPKAGGPNYLMRFAREQVISTNIAAAGGNAGLVSLAEE